MTDSFMGIDKEHPGMMGKWYREYRRLGGIHSRGEYERSVGEDQGAGPESGVSVERQD